MSHQDFGRGDQSTPSKLREAAGDALSQASDIAKEAGSKAKQAASDATFTVTEQVKEMLDRQIGSSANLAGHFASSVKRAADDISQESPLIGNFVRSFAEKVEDYAEDLQDHTVEHVARAASDFTRRQPALAFGLAALAGFLAFRTMKSAPNAIAPSIQPDQQPSGAARSR